jgi:hypothetical protein
MSERRAKEKSTKDKGERKKGYDSH